MIKYHYHASPRDVPRLGIARGDPLCHVYSDTSLEELVGWGLAHGLRPEWVHDGTLPHYDAFGARLEWCGPGVTRAELKADIRAWRANRRARGAGLHPRHGHFDESGAAAEEPRPAPDQGVSGVPKTRSSRSSHSSET